VKRNKEAREQRTDRGLSLHRFFQPVSGCMNVVSVEAIEDFEVLFKAFADVRRQDRTVQRPLGAVIVGLKSRELRVLSVTSVMGLVGFPWFDRFLAVVCSIRLSIWMLSNI